MILNAIASLPHPHRVNSVDTVAGSRNHSVIRQNVRRLRLNGCKTCSQIYSPFIGLSTATGQKYIFEFYYADESRMLEIVMIR